MIGVISNGKTNEMAARCQKKTLEYLCACIERECYYQRNELFKERHLPGLSVTTHHMAPSSGLSVTGKAKHG